MLGLGPGRYAVVIGPDVHHYTHWDQIPDEFDNLVAFVPEIPPEPHTDAQHADIERLPAILRDIMARERRNARSNPDR